MKRILTFLLAAALLLTSLSCALSASAAAESSDWMTKLTNKTLIQVVEKEIGKGWTLYQPNPREEDTKLSSNSFLKNVKLYPVVARKDDAMQLIILKKVNGKWKVDVCNDKALTRPELTIRNFSMDENVSSSDTKYTVYFDYLDAEGKVYVLSLTLYTEFESMFDDLYYLDGGVWESPSVSIEFINDRGFELYSYYSGGYTSTYHVYMYGKANFGVDEFQFADVPLQFSDLLTSAVCNAPEEGAPLYIAPDANATPVAQVHYRDEVQVIQQNPAGDWTIVCYQGNFCSSKRNTSTSRNNAKRLRRALAPQSLFIPTRKSAKITKIFNFRVKKLTRTLELRCGMWYHNCAIQGNGKTRRYAHENDAF